MTSLGAHPQRLDLYVHPGDPIDVSIAVLDGSGATPGTWPTSWAQAANITDADGALLWSFVPTTTSTAVVLSATSQATATWAWSAYAGRLVVTVTPPGGGPAPLALGWVHLYRP
ncbi:MAG: hypothetical protein JOY78_03935 [Pseudonocardia sp.]|nr:hypothetical protein [Pseudonocardia sp.]